jgi:NAD+ kinase
MQVLIFGRSFQPEYKEPLQELFRLLESLEIGFYVYTPFLSDLKDKGGLEVNSPSFDGYSDFKKHKIDYIISLGGDGTILNAITIIRDHEVPILGINLGRLGFLASTEKKNIEAALKKLKDGQVKIINRTMLHLKSKDPLFGDTPIALNDFTISKQDSSAMITINAWLDDRFLNSYWADGLIVSTPTGSTGYNLSCGGPIIFPNSDSFAITAIAPHNLTVRPIVIPDTSKLTFEIKGRGDNFLCTLDSRHQIIDASLKLKLSKCRYEAKIAVPKGITFMKTLRNKLNWGSDYRN